MPKALASSLGLGSFAQRASATAVTKVDDVLLADATDFTKVNLIDLIGAPRLKGESTLLDQFHPRSTIDGHDSYDIHVRGVNPIRRLTPVSHSGNFDCAAIGTCPVEPARGATIAIDPIDSAVDK